MLISKRFLSVTDTLSEVVQSKQSFNYRLRDPKDIIIFSGNGEYLFHYVDKTNEIKINVIIGNLKSKDDIGLMDYDVTITLPEVVHGNITLSSNYDGSRIVIGTRDGSNLLVVDIDQHELSNEFYTIQAVSLDDKRKETTDANFIAYTISKDGNSIFAIDPYSKYLIVYKYIDSYWRSIPLGEELSNIEVLTYDDNHERIVAFTNKKHSANVYNITNDGIVKEEINYLGKYGYSCSFAISNDGKTLAMFEDLSAKIRFFNRHTYENKTFWVHDGEKDISFSRDEVVHRMWFVPGNSNDIILCSVSSTSRILVFYKDVRTGDIFEYEEWCFDGVLNSSDMSYVSVANENNIVMTGLNGEISYIDLVE